MRECERKTKENPKTEKVETAEGNNKRQEREEDEENCGGNHETECAFPPSLTIQAWKLGLLAPMRGWWMGQSSHLSWRPPHGQGEGRGEGRGGAV